MSPSSVPHRRQLTPAVDVVRKTLNDLPPDMLTAQTALAAKTVTTALSDAGYVVTTQADVFRIVREAADLRSALRDARHSMCDAHVLLSPGMKAGTAESKAKLAAAIEKANDALNVEPALEGKQ